MYQKTHQVLKRETSRLNPAWQVQTLEQELRGLRLSYEEHEHLRHLHTCQEDLWKNPLISSHTIYILVLNIYIYIKYNHNIYILRVISYYRKSTFPAFSKKHLCINFTRWQVVNLFTRSKRTKQLVCSARTRPWRLLEPVDYCTTRSRYIRWFRPGGASRRTSEGQVDTETSHCHK